MINEIIYISSWLLDDKGVGNVGQNLLQKLVDYEVKHCALSNTSDFWCRDYMPVHIVNGRYVGYHYRPDYLWDYPTKRKYITQQEVACEELNLNIVDKLDIIFDGGNYVRCGGKVVVTDKVFYENPNWRPLRLLERLEEAFEAEVIVLPWDQGDKCGHADGMVACLGNGKVLVNNYHQLMSRQNPMVKSIFKVMEHNFDIIELQYDVKKADSRSWCYLNFLETSKSIILPGLSPNLDYDDDIAARERFQSLTDKPIQQVYALPLLQSGGALHCVTWELYR